MPTRSILSYFDSETAPLYDFFGNISKGQVDTFHKYHNQLNTDRRKKPIDLIRSPTIQEIQFKYTRTIAACKIPLVPDAYYYYYAFPPIIGYAPDTPWPLAQREKVESWDSNVSGFVAEHHRAIEGFTSFARQMKRIKQRAFPKRGRNETRAADLGPCDVGSAHLALEFGIKPVVSDLYKMVEHYNGRLKNPPYLRFVTKTKNKASFDYINGWEGLGEWHTEERVITYWQPSTENQQLRAGNPAEWAWELIPFSFVVDWALPIGDWIGSLDSLNGMKMISGTKTRKERFYGEALPQRPNMSQHDKRVGTITRTSHQRDLINKIPIPRPPSLFDIDFTDSLKALANASALLTVVRSCDRHHF